MDTNELGARRRRILAAADKLLKHYGFHKTTVSDIAREARVGVGTVYLEFASKSEIVAALSLEAHAAVLQAMHEAAAQQGSYTRRLQMMLDQRVRRFVRFAHDGQHGLEVVTCACSAVAEVHRRFRQEEEDLLTAFLDEGHQAGELSVAGPRVTARSLLRIFDCFIPQPGSRVDWHAVREEMEATHRIILEGLLRR